MLIHLYFYFIYLVFFVVVFLLYFLTIQVFTLLLKRQTKIAAGEPLYFFYFHRFKEIRLDVSCESSV